MDNFKIIGLPVIVSERHRIVLDRNIRSIYGIESDDAVVMNIDHGFLYILPGKSHKSKGEPKNISAGRFNLPQAWVNMNRIDIGDFVYLIATDSGIMVCPKNLELVCVRGDDR